MLKRLLTFVHRFFPRLLTGLATGYIFKGIKALANRTLAGFVAGFCAAFAEGKSTLECLMNAVSYGSAACLSEGTKPPTKGDVERLLSEIKIERI